MRTPKPATTEGKPILQVSGLKVSRGPVRVLDGVDWTVREREHWVILGPNGCGKTSLLAALSGLVTPTEGDVEVLGARHGVSDWRDLRKFLGIVSAQAAAFVAEDEPVMEVVVSGLRAGFNLWDPPTRAELAKARTLLRASDLAHLVNRPWCALSQGERQRVLIARALINRPRLLILDEPCAGLDPLARGRFLETLAPLFAPNSGTSLVLITHHVEEIAPGFTHAMLLKDGRTFASGLLRSVVTSRSLSAAFGAPLKVTPRKNGRFVLG